MKNISFYAHEDPFFTKQPAISFGAELEKPMFSEKPAHFGTRQARPEEVLVSNVSVVQSFADPERVLETAYADFESFTSLFCDKNGTPFLFRTERAALSEEAFRLSVSDTECVIYAGDTEGIRRALYFLEDEMLRLDGPFLPKGEVYREPHIKRRITRNFFTPHQANLELQSEEDYYQDGYLNRLAHQGVNGLWIFLHLKDLVPSKIVPEYGQNSEKMLDKLRRITEKCARFGIRVYALGIEPYSTHQNPALAENHPDMLGSTFWGGGQKAVCPSTEKGRAYIEECMYTLFTLVPRLAGFIGITLGEAVAGCGSVATQAELDCPHCTAKGLTKPQALAETERLLKRGMQKAKPDAEFISWTYAMRNWTPEMQKAHCAARDTTIPLMNNFEDRGTTVQLGKPRTTNDYWLSFAGPGAVFQNGAAASGGAPLYAKLQVCASHELATVPYVPVPGILYDKYQAMRRFGVEGAMYCWFFGNYPSMMNQAAGALGFLPFPETKPEFLRRLAALYTTAESTETLVKAWQCFEAGYSACPYNVAFAWFGPLNDAAARPLHLLPIDMAMPSNWILSDSCEGDRFGELTGMMHTPEEAETLLCEMEKHWNEGLALLKTVPLPEEMYTVAEAISFLFSSAKNLLSFYLLRNRLGYGEGNSVDILQRMEEIAREEIQNSTALASLCEKDTRLGYHSEAVGYKFFPEKLLWRVNRLQEMLETEFPVVSSRLQEGKCPLAFFEGEGHMVYPLASHPWQAFVMENGTADPDTKIRLLRTADSFLLEIDARHDDPICIDAEFRMFVPYAPVTLHPDGTATISDDFGYFLTADRKAEEVGKWQTTRENGIYRICLSKAGFGLSDHKAFRLGVRRLEKKSSWKKADRVFPRLMYGRISPDEKVFIL